MSHQTHSPKRAIVLLSGGLDSSTVLGVANSEGFETHALSFNYGQRHQIEIASAKAIARRIGAASHTIVDIDLRAFGGSALTADIEVPKGRTSTEIGGGIPITYVPARNTIFLSYALAVAETKGASAIFLGVSAIDYSGYPDCRPEFIAAFQNLADLALASTTSGSSIQIRAPLQYLTKAETIELGIGLGVDYSLTFSCYDPSPSGGACGACDSCVLRANGFASAKIADPTIYSRAPRL